MKGNCVNRGSLRFESSPSIPLHSVEREGPSIKVVLSAAGPPSPPGRGTEGEASKRRTLQIPAALVALLLVFPLNAQPASVRTARADAFEAATISLPGFLVEAAGVTGPGGRPGVALLISAQKDRKGPKTLLFFDPQRRTLETLAARLHEEVNAVTGFDLDGSGALAPIAGMPGVLFTAAGAGHKLLESKAIDLRSVTGSGPGRPWIPIAHTGLLELLAPAPGGGLARGRSFPLPVRAERLRWGVRLSSPPVTLLPGDPPLFVAGPQAEGRRRLKTVLLLADGSAPFEAWSLLPGEERLVTFDRGYLRLDGAPALAATTFEKFGVFAKKRLRLFLLGRDRSRKGSAPSLAIETDCPLWFRLDSLAADADGDGRQDLVLAHPGGLRGKELLVSAYRSLGGGKFDKDPRRWKLNEEATDWLYGADLTGDGTPDFLVYVGDHLFLYPGDPKGARPLAGRPLWSFPVPGAPKKNQQDNDDEAPPDGETLRDRDLRVLELPGGGRIALARGAQKDGRTVLTFVERR
jgi:hypothetical protein